MEVQTVFKQMETVVNERQTKINKVLNENDRLVDQVMANDVMNSVLINCAETLNVNWMTNKCLLLETESDTTQAKVLQKQFEDLVKSYNIMEEKCISLEVQLQTQKENIFQQHVCEYKDMPTFQ